MGSCLQALPPHPRLCCGSLARTPANSTTGHSAASTSWPSTSSRHWPTTSTVPRASSASNLKYCLRFYQFYATPAATPFGQQPVDQIPWGHNILIFTKCSSAAEAGFYIAQTIAQGWSRDVLALQLKSRLHERAGKAVSNFARTLPAPQSDLAQQTLKDPYTFDFMAMTAPYNERDVERQLTQHITQFLLELGKGFAFIGRQYHLEVAGNDYYIDLLFYHVTLKCYVVIELKNRRFIPEYAGKLNFYLSAVDSLLKRSDDGAQVVCA